MPPHQLTNNLSEKSKKLLDVYMSDFGMQFAYGKDGALQIHQQHAPVAVDLVYNI